MDIIWNSSRIGERMLKAKSNLPELRLRNLKHPTILIVPVDVPWCSLNNPIETQPFPGKETAEALVGLGMVRASDAWPICLGWVLYGMLHLAPNIPIIRCSRTIIQVSHNKAGTSYLA